MDRLVYLLYRALCRTIAAFPIESVARFGSFIGWIAYFTLRRYRKLAIRNLTIAFGEEKSPAEIRAIARRHFCSLGANFLSGAKVDSMSAEELLSRITVEGMEHFLAASAGGRGTIAILSHFGNWEVLGLISPLVFPSKCGVFYQKIRNPYIDAHIHETRSRFGLRLFDRKQGLIAATTFTKQGGVIGILSDQHAGDAGVWCPFFGRLASSSPFAATLALRTKCPMISISSHADGPGRWRFVVTPALQVPVRNIGTLTAEVNKALEQLVAQSPEDWFWVHNRWKTPKPNFMLSNYKRGVVVPTEPGALPLKPFRIVVRSSNWLGDAVMSTPAVQAIKRGRPDAHVTIATRSKLADYWKRVPEVDELILIEPKDSVFSVARKLSANFDVAIVFPKSIRTGLEVWLARIPRRVGYPAKWRDRLFNQLVIRDKKPKVPHPAPHQVGHYLELARAIGVDVSSADTFKPSEFFPSPLRIPPPAAAPAGEESKIRLGLCPGAEYGPAKRWLPERFAEVASIVAKQVECEWVLFGVEGDAPAGDAISKLLEGNCTNLIGKTTLGELAERLLECQLVLTNDTGTMHLAAFLGVPTVAIFGSTEPRLTGPLGTGHHVLRHQVECSPCFLRECPIDFRCMNAVTAEETVDAVLDTLRKSGISISSFSSATL